MLQLVTQIIHTHINGKVALGMPRMIYHIFKIPSGGRV